MTQVHLNQIIGKHIYANLYGCDPTLIDDEAFLRNLIIDAAKIAKMNIWDIKTWRFGGEKGGISAIALILESHIAIHTWKEYNYATVDIFTCGEKSDPELALNYIISKINPKYITRGFADRSGSIF
ncbi:MAG: adenosylmethionine decarboxylase [Candidatus Methanomethyliaceae archaeon]|nr:adenosylmethionine decarboxylase [Candidatus Methanomethyliaceae archaeon]MCX8169982.1 adenosylmethionine decarboxylase [Candidatus Methanomethyliaceae archaeon]MDW7970905.1 adenosylmethionine decarboxylase [Nitrososphaerota archaeon]